MKSIILLLFILSSSILNAQDYPRNNPELLLNKTLIVKPLDDSSQKYGYQGFFKNTDLDKRYESKTGTSTDYSSVVNKSFVVEDVVRFEKYGRQRCYLKLKDSEGSTVYFDYDLKFEHSFPFKVEGGLVFPDGFFCNDFKSDTDKFTGEQKTTTNASEGITLLKIVKGADTKIYMSINTPGSTLNVNEKGVILLLDNGQKIEKPEAKLDVKVGSSKSYTYNAFFELTKKDIDLLTAHSITDTRLYIYDSEKKYGNTIKEYLKCLTK